MTDAGTPQDLAGRLARLGDEIDKAERKLATLRHEGERHFIDDQPVNPAVTAALRELAGAAGELAQLRRLHGDGPTPVNPPDGAPPPELAANLARLEARIAALRQVAAGGPHTGERHFIDG